MANRSVSTTNTTFKPWPARFKAAQVEVFESSELEFRLKTNDVRKAVPSLRKDAILLKEYPSGVRPLAKSKDLFFDEPTLIAELKRNRGQDALMFLAWFERTVLYPAQRKRVDRQRVADQRATNPSVAHDGDGNEVKSDGGAKSATGSKAQSNLSWKTKFIKPLDQIWRGEMDLCDTFLAGGVVAFVCWMVTTVVLNSIANPSDYEGDYKVRIWIVAAALLASTLGPIWWCIGLVRCALRYQREHRGLLIPFLAFMLGASILLKMCAVALNDTGEWLLSWYEEVVGTAKMVRVIHDPVLGRLVLKGPIGLGSYKALKAAMEIKPRLHLIELDSPGGYVVEGLAMARLIRTNHMDTVSFNLCASACTLLLASGEDRYLGPDVEVGFHRSSSIGQEPSSSWNPTDYQIADYYRARGTDDNFIKKALDTPSFDLWIPDHGDMLKAGYANKLWSERRGRVLIIQLPCNARRRRPPAKSPSFWLWTFDFRFRKSLSV